MGWLADALAPSHQKPIFLREKKNQRFRGLAGMGWLADALAPSLQKTNFP